MAIFFRQTENKQNTIIDYGVLRLERILRLREIAIKEKNVAKSKQAFRLFTWQTEKLNARYHHMNTFNFN
jgi:hypothetical protein